MHLAFRTAGFAVSLSLSATAMAADKWVVQPVQVGQETVRYQRGVPTLDLELKDGVVQVTPLPLDHGGLSFGIAVYNDSRVPANVGIENISVQFGGAPVKVFSREELEKKAESRAAWQMFAVAMVGGLAAAAAASQQDTYRHTLVTPRGTYRSYWSGPSAAGQLQAAAIVGGTGFGLAAINNQLDATRDALGNQIIQLTTVDPGESYAGKIVVDKLKGLKALPARVSLTITWNGESYPFTFQIAKPGTAAPAFTAITRPSNLTNFAQAAEAPAPSATSAAVPAPVSTPVPASVPAPATVPPVVAPVAPSAVQPTTTEKLPTA